MTNPQWNVHRAFAMLCKCLKWRIETNIIDIIAKGDVGLSAEDEDYARQGPAKKSYAVGMTDSLMPIICVHAKRHLAKEQSADTMTKYVIACAESFRSIVRHPNDKIVLVFDLTGFSLKNMDWHSLLTIISILEAYYPETLYKLYIYAAPWIFQGIWKALAPMLDSHVRAKISFVNKPQDLSLIPADRLESCLGGDLVDVMEWTPTSEGEKPAMLRTDPKRRQYWAQYMQEAKAYEEVTRRWVASDGQDDSLMDERHYMALKVRYTFLSLSSFFCASSMYNRSGIIRDDFALEWTYKQKDGRVIKHVVGEDMSLPGLEKVIQSREGTSGSRYARNKEHGQNKDSGAAYGAAAGAGVATQSRSRGDGRYQAQQGSQTEMGSNQRSRTNAEQTRGRNTAEPSAAGFRGNEFGYAAGAGAGAGAAAAGGAAMMSQSHSSRPNLSHLMNTNNSRAGSSSASIFSSSSEDDVFVDADDFSGGQGESRGTNQYTQAYAGQPGVQDPGEYVYGGEEPYAEEPQEGDVGAEEGTGTMSVTTQNPTTHPSGDEPRRRRGSARPMIGENEQLAGFGNLPPEAHEQIAESNEKMREPFDPNQKRTKPSLLSRLNCCSGKNID